MRQVISLGVEAVRFTTPQLEEAQAVQVVAVAQMFTQATVAVVVVKLAKQTPVEAVVAVLESVVQMDTTEALA
jgi:hypothetical protein